MVEKNKMKKIIFSSIVVLVFFITLLIIADTAFKVITYETKGPVHWHADFEIWNCGEEVDIIDPSGLSNKVGTNVLHEHNDNRVHVEGLVKSMEEVNLQNFFEKIGGSLTKTKLIVPTNIAALEINNGDLCNNQPGKLQVFVYKVKNPDSKLFKYEQKKLENFEEYVLSPRTNVPPGDCIIVEFDQEKTSTDKLCKTYQII
jgi:hypothetical protein